MKLDIESSEYTVVPHLVLSQAMCMVDAAAIEWHGKLYRGGTVLKRAAESSNLTKSESGVSMAQSLVEAIPLHL